METLQCKFSLTFKKNLPLACQTISTTTAMITACTDEAKLIKKIISPLLHPCSVMIATQRPLQSRRSIPNHSRRQLFSLQLKIVGHSSKINCKPRQLPRFLMTRLKISNSSRFSKLLKVQARRFSLMSKLKLKSSFNNRHLDRK